MAEILAANLEPFSPDMIIYLERGGSLLGNTVAHLLGVPVRGLDISYRLSRKLDPVPKILEPLVWPAKEAMYRLSAPVINSPFLENNNPLPRRIGLVDDTASTGRTLSVALATLRKLGIDRERIQVAVLRCGRRARNLVDHFLLQEPVLVVHDER